MQHSGKVVMQTVKAQSFQRNISWKNEKGIKIILVDTHIYQYQYQIGYFRFHLYIHVSCLMFAFLVQTLFPTAKSKSVFKMSRYFDLF